MIAAFKSEWSLDEEPWRRPASPRPPFSLSQRTVSDPLPLPVPASDPASSPFSRNDFFLELPLAMTQPAVSVESFFFLD